MIIYIISIYILNAGFPTRANSYQIRLSSNGLDKNYSIAAIETIRISARTTSVLRTILVVQKNIFDCFHFVNRKAKT